MKLVPAKVNPRSASTIPTPAKVSKTPHIWRVPRRSFLAARASSTLHSGMVASINAPCDASVRRRLALKVTGKTVKKMAPRRRR